MLDRRKEEKVMAYAQFVTACREAIDRHCASVVQLVPKENLDALDEETLVLLLSGYVCADVMELGLRIMCWRMVNDTVHEAIVGMIAKVKEKMRERGEEDVGLEETSPLS